MRKGWAVETNTVGEVIEAVKRLPITKVLSHYGVKFEKHTNDRVYSLCPFHLDNKIGSFSVSISTNKCWCFSCNQGGNVISAVSKIIGKGYAAAALQVAADEGLIDEKTYKSLAESDEYVKMIDDKNAKATDEFIVKESEGPSDYTKTLRSDVYEAFKKVCTLSSKHRKDLVEKRQLSEDRIESDYFTMPTNIDKTLDLLRKELNGKYTDDELSKVPGFFMDQCKSGWKLSFLSYKGLGIILRDVNGKAIAIQTRLDDPDASCRYMYMSGEMKGSAMKGGASVGTVIDYRPATKETKKLAITEGRFKSEILSRNGFNVFSVQGVNNYKGMIPQIKLLPFTPSKIDIFYDADQIRNPNVCAAANKLVKYLKNGLSGIEINIVLWDYNDGKGIDDLIFAGKKNACIEFAGKDYIKVTESTFIDAVYEAGFDPNTNAAKLTREDRERILSVFEVLMREKLGLNKQEEALV